jgi:hypothetical protein
MSGFLHDAAHAALLVAIGLLACTVAARAVLWARVDDARAQRLAREHVDPLSVWCLVAATTEAVALGLSGHAGLLALALPVGIGAAAVLLGSDDETAPVAAPAPEERPRGAVPADGSLWANREP